MPSRKIEVHIVGDTKSLEKAFGKAGKAGSSFGHAVGRVGGAIGTVAKTAAFAAGAAGIGAIAVTLKQGIAEFSEAAKVSAQTGAVLKSTGGIANVTAKQVGALSAALMQKTGVDDEAIQSGQNMLLTFTKIRNEVGKGNDIFNQATKATLNLSVAMGKDMQSSAIMVGKALNDPLKGMTALNKAGIQFTDEQKKTIKTLVASGQTMKAQKVILKELETQFGGSAEAIGKTLPGQINILKETFNNLAGELVGRAMPTIQKALGRINEFMNDFFQAKGLTAKVKVVWSGVREAADGLIGQFQKALGGGKWRDLLNTVIAAMDRVDWNAAAQKLASGIGKALEIGGEIAGKLTAAFVRAVSAVDWVAVGQEIRKGFQKGIGNFARESGLSDFGPLKNWAKNLGKETIMPWTIGAEEEAKRGGRRIAAGAKLGLSSMPASVAAIVAQAISGVRAQAGPAGSAGQSVGSSLGVGIQRGIGATIASVAASAVNMVAQAIAAAKAAAETGSPSKRTEREIGRPMGEGVIRGWILSTAALPEKMKESVRKAIEAARGQVERGRERLASAFGNLGGQLIRAFDAETGAHATPSEGRIREIEERRQTEDLLQRQADAQAALAQAQQEGGATAGEMARLQQDLARATEDIELASLRRRAERERLQWESRREQQRLALEARLAAVTAHFEKEGGTVKEAMTKIAALMRAFGIDFATAGELVGNAFVAGLKRAIGAAAATAGALKGTITKVSRGIGGGGQIPLMAGGGHIERSGLAMVHKGETVVPSGRNSGGNVFTFNFPNYLGDRQEMIALIRRELNHLSARNVSLNFG